MSEYEGDGVIGENTQAFTPFDERTTDVPSVPLPAPEAGYAAPAVSSDIGREGGIAMTTAAGTAGANRPIHNTDDVATMTFAPVTMEAAEMAALGKGASTATKRHPKRGLIIALSILAALIVMMVAAFFGANWYYQNRVSPGVRFGQIDVAGKTSDELTQIVNKAVADSAITVTDSEGNAVKADLKSLGVSVDVKQTVNNLLSAKSGNMIARINPFDKQTVPLSAKTNDSTLTTYLTDTLVKKEDRAVASSVAYNGTTFAVTKGREGKEAQPATVVKAVKKAIAEPGATQKVTVQYSQVAMPITVETATATANDANKRLSSPLTIGNSKDKSFTVPAEVVAKWITVTPDVRKGTIALSYDQDAVKSYLAQNLAKELDQDMVVEKNVVNNDGTVLTVSQEGVDGVSVQSTDATADQVIKALGTGDGCSITADVKVTEHKTESRKVDYTSPNGDPHAVINLSEQKVYAYKGSTLVKTFLVSTGKPSTPTDNGTFFVHTKYTSQTMRGEDYVTPNVPWVTYYNQGEGFHGAPWNPDGIASGTPKSHGCTNMNVADAKWIYDFLPVGAMVQVVGSTPSAAVR
ncbi:L,D-transpeptidase family protein [Bifidobacterium leontopitheci]|uniref:Peptidoglycan-binding protein n=1 Tax=Bifidobacterium leontopitheci TaxID=2650774 RepID=A0A6I1GQR7_9BIFI|nr:L,D-transpeptidase family protein [Bifidobacterium leontopitheci]KAB7790448.1 peptidoglycan-binding protein [Bifidobacterium leontopitheci]